MMKWKQILLVIGVSAVSAVTSVWIYGKANRTPSSYVQSASGSLPVNYAGFFDNVAGNADPIDFTKAANAAVPAVVHIKTKIAAKNANNKLPRKNSNSMEDFFNDLLNNGMGGGYQPEQRASGSGVIISDDGYIITNNHVVTDGGQGIADEIMVTLSNKKTYKAKLIGKDPSSDIAVLKIDGTGFPFLLYGNSDNVKLGQWVLAIGYPLTLEATVTAGIVSAKGRSIGINARQSDRPIESFIQTDAAVNQGNSGGALIATDGQLIGINSAIYAPTGTYAGYSFAIPVNIVKKIVNDLIEFGDVKRGYLGISYPSNEIENERLVKQSLPEGFGVYVQAVPSDGAAAAAGIKKGDVITKINGNPVTTGLEMSAHLASFKPGDKVTINFARSGKENTTTITLKGTAGKLDAVVTSALPEIMGAELENVDEKTALKNNIDGGVVIKKIKSGGPLSKTRMETGFIITSVNGQDVTNIEELNQAVNNLKGETIQLEGIYPGYEGIYRYPLNLEE